MPGGTGRTAVYRLYDADGVLLYVGIADGVTARWKHHGNAKEWWPQVARKDATWHATRTGALSAEAHAIATEEPVHNRRRDSSVLARVWYDGRWHSHSPESRIGHDWMMNAALKGHHCVIYNCGRPAAVLMDIGWYREHGGAVPGYAGK